MFGRLSWLLDRLHSEKRRWRGGSVRGEPNTPIYAVPILRVLALVGGLATLVVFDVLLTACGGRLFGAARTNIPCPLRTYSEQSPRGSCRAFWWLWGYASCCSQERSRQKDGANRSRWRNGCNLQSPCGKSHQCMALESALGPNAQGKRTGGGDRCFAGESQATEFDPRWPLKVSACRFRGWKSQTGGWTGATKSRSAGNCSGDCRSSSSVQAHSRGRVEAAFWLAPHWWFVDGVGREDADANPEDTAPPLVGPPYHRILAARARQHAHAILRATHVDMIFVEDGVSFRNIERVLRVITELYDVHGGRRASRRTAFSRAAQGQGDDPRV